MNYFSVCVVCDDKEIKWITEFIDYHLVVGATHVFVVYAERNPLQGNTLLKPYVDKGLVTIIHVPSNHAWDRWAEGLTIAKDKAIELGYRWLAIIDIDEFILPMQTDSVPEFLKDYEDYSGVCINWFIYGTSGYIESPPSVLKHLVHRAEDNWRVNGHVKSILNPKMIKVLHAHTSSLTSGFIVNEDKEQISSFLTTIKASKIRLNHYVIRSRKEFEEIDSKMTNYKDEIFYDDNNRNEVFDDEIYRRFGQRVEEFHKSIHS